MSDLRTTARALLNRDDIRLTRKAGSFLGQCVAEPYPLTEAQDSWLNTLLERAGLPPFRGEVS